MTLQVQGALVFNPTFSPSITNDPNAATIMATINSALSLYQALFVDPVTVSIDFQQVNTGLGASSTAFVASTYSAVHNRLNADASSPDDTTAIAHLPNGANNPVPSGNNTINLTSANARALGICSVTCTPTFDGTISLNLSIMNLSRSGPQDPNKYDLLTVVMHEIDEVLGTISGVGASQGAFVMDLFRYDANGNRTYSSSAASVSYFSLDGVALLAQYNQQASGDYGDFISGGPVRVQNAFLSPGTQADLGVEIRMLNAGGWDLNTVPEPTSISLFLAGVGSLLLRRRKRT
jgi:hypothetical protein